MTPYEKLLWLDLETTGLDPREGMVLQVAAAITNQDGEQVEETWEAVVELDRCYPEIPLPLLDGQIAAEVARDWPDANQTVERAWFLADNYVRTMHTETGLWDKLCRETGNLPLVDIEQHLIGLVEKHTNELNSVRLAGSSVGFDKNWLEHHMPNLHSLLPYRVVDVSTLLGVGEATGLLDMNDKPALVGVKHDAKADIEHSINLYKWFLQEVKAPF